MGWSFWEIVKPIAVEMQQSAGISTHEESIHMCILAEILCGVVKGSKHWPFVQQKQLVCPALPPPHILLRWAHVNLHPGRLTDLQCCAM